MRKGIAVSLATLAAAALPAVPATAKKKKQPGPISEVSASTSAAGSGAVLTATATCPGKRRVIGGGFLVNPQTTNIRTHPSESVRVDEKSWRASAQVFDPGPPSGEAGTLTTYAYCRKRAPKITAVSASAPLPASLGATGASNVLCPGSTKLSSGGFLSPPTVSSGGAFQAAVLDSYPSGLQTWSTNGASAIGGNLTSYAYCLKGKPAPAIASVTSSPAISGGSSVSAIAPCTGKRTATGGGFQQPAPTAGTLFVHESRRISKAWQVSAVAFFVQPGQSAPLVSHAVCGR